jgi:aspartate aminotransferase
MFSQRINDLLPSPTLAFDAKVKDLQAKGIEVINLTLGEPDFDTPNNIRKAGIKAIDRSFTHYTATAGIIELRRAICKKFLKDNNVDYNPQDIIVGNGSKQLLYEIFQAICNKNDEIIIPTPTWSTYVEQIKLAQGKPIFIKLNPPFKLTLKDLQKKVSSKTKAILINSPSNPTGAVIEKEELIKIARFASSKNILIISDEIYEKIIYEKKHFCIASINNKIKDQVVTINGVSKSYAMTGWRLGFAAGPSKIIAKMVDLQSQITSNANSIAQIAALEALNGNQNAVNKMEKEFLKRRNLIYKRLKKIKKLKVINPEGAFYFFVSIEKLLGGKYKTSTDWCNGLLEKEKVAVIPGEAFLYKGYFRLSFTAPINILEKALTGIERFINE